MPYEKPKSPATLQDWIEMPLTVSAQGVSRPGYYLLQCGIEAADIRGGGFSDVSNRYQHSKSFSINMAFSDATVLRCGLILYSGNVINVRECEIAGILSNSTGLEGLVGVSFARIDYAPKATLRYINLPGLPTPIEAAIQSGKVTYYASGEQVQVRERGGI